MEGEEEDEVGDGHQEEDGDVQQGTAPACMEGRGPSVATPALRMVGSSLPCAIV